MRYALAVDIGGTKISIVLGDEHGRILGRRGIPTETGKRTQACVRSLIYNLKSLVNEAGISKNKIIGVGVGIPGPVDSRKGIVPLSPHLKSWKGIPLGKIISRELKLPVRMANDANAAALGEKVFGEGQGESDFAYLTVSTGIGGGIVVHDRLLEGFSFMAGEVGHMTVVPAGELCKCGKHGCLEAYASGTAIANCARQALKERQKTSIGKYVSKGEDVSAKAVGQAAKHGDRLAFEIYRICGYYLGIGISNLLHVLNLPLVIIGGGVLKSAPPVFWKSAMESVEKYTWPAAFRGARIVRSKIKEGVGDLGALALVFESSRP